MVLESDLPSPPSSLHLAFSSLPAAASLPPADYHLNLSPHPSSLVSNISYEQGSHLQNFPPVILHLHALNSFLHQDNLKNFGS